MRVADESLAPKWVFEGHDAPEFSEAEYITQTEGSRIAAMNETLMESDIIVEREAIERCAETGAIYHMNSSWSKVAKDDLKEYAMVCGVDTSKLREIDASSVTMEMDDIKKTSANSRGLIVEAQAVEDSVELDADPFRLDEKALMGHMKKSDWEVIGKESKMEEKPSMMSGAIKPLRGGEDYFTNSDISVARGQNSITDANAIGEMADSDTPDTRTRLRSEAEERESIKETERKDWEDEKIAAMSGSSIIPKGNVFLTEVMDAQGGLGESPTRPGVYSNLDPKDMPDRTAGEKIADSNEQARKSIQRPSRDDREWDSLKPSETRGVSDTFADALKAALNK